MKKLLLVALMSMVCGNCTATKYLSLYISNRSDKNIDVEDQDYNKISIDAEGRGTLLTRLHAPQGTFMSPSNQTYSAAIITISDGETSNSITIDQDTKTLIVESALELSLAR